MIVTIAADVLGIENNGTTTACMNFVRYLQACGDEVRILCCDKDKKDLPNYYVVPTRNFGPLLNKIIENNGVALAKPDKNVIKKAVAESDVVHVMMPFALGKTTTKIAKKMGKPISAGFHVQAENFTAHIGMMNCRIANYLTYKSYYKKMYKYVDAIHYPTEFIKNTFEKSVHKTTNSYVISNGVHNRFKKMESPKPEEYKDKFVILFTGRYSKEKSHRILIKAVSRSKYKDKIQLIFAGEGPCEKKLKKYSKKCGINMPYMNFFKKDDLVKVINYSDLYCHPAEIEIEAIACLEAITCGIVPIISNSKRCATKAFALDSNNLFNCNDTKDLANKIDYWIEHPEEKAKRSEEYLGFTKRFNQDECMKNMRIMLTDIMEKNKKEN